MKRVSYFDCLLHLNCQFLEIFSAFEFSSLMNENDLLMEGFVVVGPLFVPARVD